jgi:uncharacterized protein YidB (DUF937 family)
MEEMMGMLDDVLGSSLPKGSGLAKPLMIAFAALLASGALTRGVSGSGPSTGSAPVGPGGPSASGTPAGDAESGSGGLLSGLGGLLSRFQQSGQGDVINSWIGSGQNQPISPSQLGTALGPDIIKTLAERTGLSEAEIASHLSQLLPGVVDKLTPNGRLPTIAELSQ